MDRQKIREIVKQTHPNHKLIEPDDNDARYAADTDADDVDVSGLSPTTWKKFGTTPADKEIASRSSGSGLRERFRPKKLTGASSETNASAAAARPKSVDATPGKLTLERLVPEDAAADTEDSIDVLVDEDQGVIGESDSGPEDE